MGFPETRPRRLRRNETVRTLFRETTLNPADLVWPIFVEPGEGVRTPIESLPGQHRFSPDEAAKAAQEAWEVGIRAMILFGVPDRKDPHGSRAYAKDGVVPRTIGAIRERVPEMLVITDVCLCEYTDHGHCGVVRDGEVVNDETLDLLAREAVTHARAGAGMVAPSDMMDGRVGYIREALDEQDHEDVPIMAYSAKYASAFYGPFREAAASTPSFGDRRTYQMDPANASEALREVDLDEEEAADVVMVKPAGPYLDVLHRVRDHTELPVAAYQVSGEYAMIQAAGERGWIERERVVMESLLAIKRAGADLILSYFAPEAARRLQQGG